MVTILGPTQVSVNEKDLLNGKIVSRIDVIVEK